MVVVFRGLGWNLKWKKNRGKRKKIEEETSIIIKRVAAFEDVDGLPRDKKDNNTNKKLLLTTN